LHVIDLVKSARPFACKVYKEIQYFEKECFWQNWLKICS